jgi:hypothetical protein
MCRWAVNSRWHWAWENINNLTTLQATLLAVLGHCAYTPRQYSTGTFEHMLHKLGLAYSMQTCSSQYSKRIESK